MKRFIVSVPLNKLKFTFIKSQGPGGQAVNKSKLIEKKKRRRRRRNSQIFFS